MNQEIESSKLLNIIISPKGILTSIIGLATLLTLIITISAWIVNLKSKKEIPLSSPHLILDGQIVKWGMVKSAEEYIIYVNDEEFDITPVNSIFIGDFEQGAYIIEVASKKGDEISPKSDKLQVTIK